MMQPQDHFDAAVQRYYQEANEDARLRSLNVGGRVEFLRTQQLVRAAITPLGDSLNIYDVGGGTGVHAEWLATDGHKVTLIDVVPHNVQVAAESGGFTAQVGDARALPGWDGSVDVTLLLGPLYHLAKRADRVAALTEAARVTKTGGVVVAVGISRMGLLNFYRSYSEATRKGKAYTSSLGDSYRDNRLGLGTEYFVTPGDQPGEVTIGTGIADMLATGRVPLGATGFPCAHGHSMPELRAEVRAAGLTVVSSHGIEGANSSLLEDIPLADNEPLVVAACELAQATDQPTTADVDRELSSHLMVVATVPADPAVPDDCVPE